MDPKNKNSSFNWFYNKVFGEESIRPRFYEEQEPQEKLPSPLRAARSLESGMPAHSQSRSALFVKQAKLLAAYEDDYVYEKPVLHYFPTYQSLSNPELRGYFTWRTALRRGDLQKTHLTYAFLYIYELLNLTGVPSAEEGYRLLCAFRDAYAPLDNRVLPYLRKWLTDFTVYYRLDPGLLADLRSIRYHNSVAVLADIHSRTDSQIMDAVKVLAPGWLKRSRFYREHTADMETVLLRVLKKTEAHYSTGKRPMVEQFCGHRETFALRLFESAVFCHKTAITSFEYRPDDSRIFRCKNGVWTVEQNGYSEQPSQRLEDLIKTVDAIMRPLWGCKNLILPATEVKWLTRIIEGEAKGLLEARQAEEEAKKAEEARKIRFDFSRLDTIRQDAAITRDKLIVDEEAEEAPDPQPEPPVRTSPIAAPEEEMPGDTGSSVPDSILPPAEYRLVHTLLYGGSLDWIRQEGLMLSVLTDSVNELLYDTFSDTVLTADEPPELIEDYIDELKEMVIQ